MRKAGVVLVLALVFVGGGAGAVLIRKITLAPGHCTSVGHVRVCAAASRTVTRWRTVTVQASTPPTPTPTVSDAWLNTSQAGTERVTTFYSVGPNLTSGKAGVPPILHLAFSAPLVGNHDLQVSCHAYSNGTGTTFHVTAASGWAGLYTQLPGPQCDYYLTTYEVTVWMDGTPTGEDLTYAVQLAP